MKFVLNARTMSWAAAWAVALACGRAHAEFGLECGPVSFNGVSSHETYDVELTDQGTADLIITEESGRRSRVSLAIEFSSRNVTTFVARELGIWIERTPDGFFLNTPHGQSICR